MEPAQAESDDYHFRREDRSFRWRRIAAHLLTPEQIEEILLSQQIEFPVIKCEGPAIRQST